MYITKIHKRQILKHNGTMTVDVNFVDDAANEAFNQSFVLPIDATLDEIKIKVSTWLEEKEASLVLDEALDITGVVTGRVERKDYENKKAELVEIMELVALGSKDANDADVKALQADVKIKYKDGYKKEK